MRTEEEVRAKLRDTEAKLKAFQGGALVELFGKPPVWFTEQIQDQISLIKWILNDKDGE